MRDTAIAISSLLFGIALITVGSGLLGTLLGVRMTLVGTTPLITGAVMAAYFAGLSVGALRGSGLIASVGHIRAFTAFASVYSAAALLHALYFDATFWAFLRFAQGACMAGLFLCTESWLNERATNQTRGQIMSIYMIVLYLAQIAGQFLLVTAPPETFVLFAAVSAIASLGAVPIALTRQPQPDLPSSDRRSIAALYRLSPLAVVGSFLSGLVVGAFYGMGPAYATLAGLGIEATAQFVALAILGGLGMQWPIGALSDRMDRRRVILAVTAGIALLSTVLVIATGRSETTILLTIALFGAVAFVLYPLSVTHANDYADSTSFVAISSGLLIAHSVGATIGPLAASAFMTAIGAMGLFVFCGVAAAACALFAAWRIRKRDAVPEDEKVPFTPLPRTSPAVTELDPRAPEYENDKEAAA